MKPTFLIVSCFIFLITCVKTPAATTNIALALDTARTECGYELGGLETRILTAQAIAVGKEGFQQIYTLEWRKEARRFRATMTLNCDPNGLYEFDSSTPVLTPQYLIAEEDSGGRYMRHVGWQKLALAENWTALVAYIDYIFGDGDRTNTCDFLACNGEVPTPCIALSI
ncbi:hypothetical protein, partial [Pseudoxanthomonas jiangsuensis]